MDLERASIIIDKRTRKFIDTIKDMTQFEGKSNVSSPYIFPALEPTNNTFYKYEYYVKAVEDCVRGQLVRGILTDLINEFDEEGEVSIESLQHEGTDPVYSNGRRIDDFGVDFVLTIGKKRAGVCFGDLFFFEDIRGALALLRFLKKNKLKSLVVIEWDDLDSSKPSQEHIREGKRAFGKRVTMKKLFEDIFSLELYDMYCEKVSSAIIDANNEIGLQAIPQMTYRYLSRFKQDRESYYKDFNYREKEYLVIKSDKKEILDRAEKKYQMRICA